MSLAICTWRDSGNMSGARRAFTSTLGSNFFACGVGDALVEERREVGEHAGALLHGHRVHGDLHRVSCPAEGEMGDACGHEREILLRAGWRARLSGETMLAPMSKHWRPTALR